ncbi:LexA family transcriptional regulator [Shinella sp.]|uniref:LexA family transcriptional regulator n=1 Tax=Shinella sp. TaxID=1870904 RepID=UPI003F711025
MIEDKAYLKPIGRRLVAVREALGFKNREDFAAAYGAPKKTFEKYEQGLSELPTKLMLWLRDKHDVNLSWLISGDGEMRAGVHEASDVVISANERMVRIKHYNVAAAAGEGLVPVDEHDEPEDIVLARSFLRRLGASPEGSQVIFARGESMLPTIPDGSLLLVDRSKTRIDDNGVFVFRVGEGIKVKRARWRADQRIDLVSDNQLAGFPPETYTWDELSAIIPLGRVMCVMRVP